MGKKKTIPYQGLRFFDVKEAKHFFGRERLVQTLLRRVHPDKYAGRARFLGILGPSGSGKSSLARAGVLASLRAGARSGKAGIHGSERWPEADILQPGTSPLTALAEVMASHQKAPSKHAVPKYREALLASSTALRDFVAEVMAKRDASQRWVLLVDQFEEVFTLCTDPAEQRAFIDNLHEAVTCEEGQAFLVLTLRADFYGQCTLDPRLNELFVQHQLLLRPMTPEELTEAMIQPALRSGCSFEADLVEILCEEVKDSPGALPLLQCALLELWRQRDGRSLTKAAYLSFGGLRGVLERRAEEIYSGLSESQQAVCRRLFLALVQVSHGPEATKRKTSLAELLDATEATHELLVVLRAFSEKTARLLTIEGPVPSHKQLDNATPRLGEKTWVEVSHEALIPGWERLQEWLAEHKDALHFRGKIEQAAKKWLRTAEDAREDALWIGPQLAIAEEWAQEHGSLLRDEPNCQAFLDASIAHREANEAVEQNYIAEVQHALEDRAFLLQSKESINQKKAAYLDEKEGKVKRQLRWAHAALSAAVILIVVLTWTFVRAN